MVVFIIKVHYTVIYWFTFILLYFSMCIIILFIKNSNIDNKKQREIQEKTQKEKNFSINEYEKKHSKNWLIDTNLIFLESMKKINI